MTFCMDCGSAFPAALIGIGKATLYGYTLAAENVEF